MAKQQILGGFEECLILAILKLSNKAYSVSIAEAVEEATGKEVTVGSIFTTLGRLEDKNFVSSEVGEATKEKGGKAKRYYRVESAGYQALQDTQEIKRKLDPGDMIPAFS